MSLKCPLHRARLPKPESEWPSDPDAVRLDGRSTPGPAPMSALSSGRTRWRDPLEDDGPACEERAAMDRARGVDIEGSRVWLPVRRARLWTAPTSSASSRAGPGHRLDPERGRDRGHRGDLEHGQVLRRPRQPQGARRADSPSSAALSRSSRQSPGRSPAAKRLMRR